MQEPINQKSKTKRSELRSADPGAPTHTTGLVPSAEPIHAKPPCVFNVPAVLSDRRMLSCCFQSHQLTPAVLAQAFFCTVKVLPPALDTCSL